MDYEFDDGPGPAHRLIEGIRGWLHGNRPENPKTRPDASDAKCAARVKPHVLIEIASAIVVILTIVGLVVGIAAPGRITGAILPVALIMWFILYKMTDRHNI